MKKIILISVIFFLVSLFLIVNKYEVKTIPNIIFISIDTLRQDHVSSYGYSRNTTPEIDKLASDGVLFANSFSSAPWTLPSHMSMFTGLPPSLHNVDFDYRSLNKKIKLFTEDLQESGYVTGGFFSAEYLKRIYGFSRGFDNYYKMIGLHANAITDKAINWISLNNKKKFFLFVHYFDVHLPYRPPVEIAEQFGVDTSVRKWFKYGKLMFLRRFSDPTINISKTLKKKIVNLYDSEIFRVDNNIGKLFDYLKDHDLYDNTVIILTSDHGEEFGEHNSFGHYHQLHSELINVPLIIKFPKKKYSGQKVDVPVSSVDLANTILKFANLEIPDQYKKYGINLIEIVSNTKVKNKANQRTILSESKKGSTLHFAVRKEGIKYITPYRFFPIVKKRIWKEVEGKMFNENMDKMDLTNILNKGKTGKSYLNIFKLLKNFILNYVNENIEGIRLVFLSESSFKGKKMYGKIYFESLPDQPPFGVNFQGDDNLSGYNKENSVNFEFLADDFKKEIVFPMTETLNKIKRMRIVINSENDLVVSRIIEISKIDKIKILAKGRSGKRNIFLLRSGKFDSGLKINLSKKEKEALRALGYIN